MAKPRALQRDSESEALFGEFAANVPEILWMREVGSERILYVSPAWETVTGHPRPQHRDEFLRIVHPEDAARVRQEADEAPHGGVDHRYRILRGDGAQRWLHARTFAVRNRGGEIYRIGGIAQDVTEEVRKDLELRQFRAAVDASAVLVTLIDPARMRYVDINDAACLALGYSREELLAMGPADVFSMPGTDLARSYERLLFGDQAASSVEGIYRRKDGTTFPVKAFRRVVASSPGEIIVAIARDITARKLAEDGASRAEERLAYLAQFDALTGLPNRHLFQDRLAQTMAQTQRGGRAMAVLFIDLDRFKLVNDAQGRDAGDRLLKTAALRLAQSVRSGDTVGRFGGDEFGVVLANLAKPGDASLVAQKIIDALSRPVELDGDETYITASIGITVYPADGTEPDVLLANADAAMYRAKEQGRNHYEYFTREMNERALRWVRMQAETRRALERGEFQVHYQPKVELATGEICGFEALLRWEHPVKGPVPPAEFIPALEETGLIVPAGEWVLRTACAQIKAWREAGLASTPIAVNLSARQFQQKGLEDSVCRILRETAVAPSLLQFELTESLLMTDPEAAARTLLGLKELGVRLSVDDFGTGYSSLAYLKRFALNELKIDRVFIRDIVADPDDAAITLAIIGLAHSLNLEVVAEGVETEAQVNFLRSHRCDQMQGFYFTGALTAAECTAALRDSRRLKPPSALDRKDTPAVLLVGGDENDLIRVSSALGPAGYRLQAANCAEVGFDVLAKERFDMVICDHRLANMSGADFLAAVRRLYPDMIRILISSKLDTAALAQGINVARIHKYVSREWDAKRLRAEVRAASLRRRKPAG